jgi:PKD repeat protein
MHSPPRQRAAVRLRAVLRAGPSPAHDRLSADVQHVPAAPPRDRRNRTHPRGQSLVEFALALPIILLLTLVTLDFGRVFLGWINLQNMARIAANYAANHPDADWSNASDADVVTYQNQIRSDASASNCSLPKVGGVQTAPTPTYTDVDGDGEPGLGDTATVAMTCQFPVITPFISSVVGSSVPVSASSVFPVKAGMVATRTGGGGGSGSAPSAAFTGNGTVAPSSVTGVAPFTVVFRDTSGGAPTSWLWTFPDDATTSTQQDPLGHTFQNPGTYLVTMKASNANGSSTQSMGITVVDAGTVDFSASATSGNAPLAVTFMSTSAPGGTAFAWSFGAGEGTGTGASASHTYATAGTFSVTLTVTYSNGSPSTTKTNYITVSPKLCTVPSFDGKKRNQVDNLWTGAGSTGTLTSGPGAPNGNGWIVTTQTITANSSVPCTASIQVNDH